MSTNDVLMAVRSGWRLLLVGLVLGAAAAGVLSWASTPLYASSVRLFVSVAATTDTAAAYQGSLFSQQRVTSYAELLTGEQLAAAVVDDLNLEMSPAEVARKVTANPLPDTVLLEVTVTDTAAQRAQDIAASLTEQFTAQVTELETPDGATASTVKVTTVQAASFDQDPISPDVTRNVALGSALGLLLALGAKLLRSRLDNTVKSTGDVHALTGAQVIGSVLEDRRLRDQSVLPLGDEHSRTVESFRALRMNLQFIDVHHPPRVIAVSSALAGEGKSVLAVNLATALAQTGSRTVLVEADLRRPRVMRYLGLAGGRGLTDVLTGNAELSQVLQSWGGGPLSVLPAGPTVPNAGDLLGSDAMTRLVEALRADHDVVVIDTPPLLHVTDAAVLSGAVDGYLVVTRHGTTRRDQLAEAASVLARVDARLLGVVLNRVPQAASLVHGRGRGYAADLGRSPVPVPRRMRTDRWPVGARKVDGHAEQPPSSLVPERGAAS